MPHRTVIDPEQRKIDVLNQALKEAIIKELNQGIPQHVRARTTKGTRLKEIRGKVRIAS